MGDGKSDFDSLLRGKFPFKRGEVHSTLNPFFTYICKFVNDLNSKKESLAAEKLNLAEEKEKLAQEVSLLAEKIRHQEAIIRQQYLAVQNSIGIPEEKLPCLEPPSNGSLGKNKKRKMTEKSPIYGGTFAEAASRNLCPIPQQLSFPAAENSQDEFMEVRRKKRSQRIKGEIYPKNQHNTVAFSKICLKSELEVNVCGRGLPKEITVDDLKIFWKKRASILGASKSGKEKKAIIAE